MDELMNRQNTKKEIISSLIVDGIFLILIIVFGFIFFDLMYLIISSLMLGFMIIVTIYYFNKFKKIQDKINYYLSDDYKINNAMDLLIKDYYKEVIDDKIEKEINAICYSLLNDLELTLEMEKKDYIFFVKINNSEVTYAISALDENFYSNTSYLFNKTNNYLLSDEYLAALDGKDSFILTSLDENEIYRILLDFIKNKINEIDNMFNVYNDALKLINK